MADNQLTAFMERLKLAQNRSGMSSSELARACGLSPQYLSRWAHADKSKNLPPSDVTLKLAQALNVDLLWLIAGTGTSDKKSNIMVISDGDKIPEGFMTVKTYSINFNCGTHGGDCIEPLYEELADTTPAIYRRTWIEAQGANPDYCKRFVAHGDSMCPIICDGDCILVDTSEEAKTHIKSRGIYALWYDGSLLCKYLTPRISGGFILSSENKEIYPPEIIEGPALQNFYTIGKVIERAGKISNYTNR
jgi:transcriptional regulator with XRE-family HTH domain